MAITEKNNVPNDAMQFIDSSTGMLSKKKNKEIVKLLWQNRSALKLGSCLATCLDFKNSYTVDLYNVHIRSYSFLDIDMTQM